LLEVASACLPGADTESPREKGITARG